MLFSSALADTGTPPVPPAPTLAGSVMPLLLIIVVFYFLIIRPNQKKIKEHDDMVKNLRRGDKVVTAGGVVGVISKIEDDNIIILEVAENVKIRVLRDTISTVMAKTVANDNKAD